MLTDTYVWLQTSSQQDAKHYPVGESVDAAPDTTVNIHHSLNISQSE